MACPEEGLLLESGKGQQTGCPGKLGGGGSTTPPCSGREPVPAPIDDSVNWSIGVGGMHASFAGERWPRLFPESLWLFVHDGALHRYIACRLWLRIWLLAGAFLAISIVFLVPLAPAIVCGRALYLARHGRLADLGYLPWYVPFLPLVFFYTSGYELLLYGSWCRLRQVDTHNFGPTYRFPGLYTCLRVIELYMMRLLPTGLTGKSRTPK